MTCCSPKAPNILSAAVLENRFTGREGQKKKRKREEEKKKEKKQEKSKKKKSKKINNEMLFSVSVRLGKHCFQSAYD